MNKIPHIESCPMCGKTESEYERQKLDREIKKRELTAFIIGRRSVNKFSRRENEIFDAFYDLGLRDFKVIADNEGISISSVETYYDRAMDKLIGMDFEL
jgi:DNA-binding NarL/FixJ family response regulator